MANRILEKNIFYNSISEQHLSFANQLTVHSWNDIINMLKFQANANAYYLEHLHKWLVGDDSAVTPEDFPNLLEYVKYVNDRFANYYTKNAIDSQLQQKADKTDLFNIDYNKLVNRPTIPERTSQLVNDSGFADESILNTKENKAHISDVAPSPTQTDVWFDTNNGEGYTEQQVETISLLIDDKNLIEKNNDILSESEAGLLNEEESLLLEDTENVIINEEDKLLSEPETLLQGE